MDAEFHELVDVEEIRDDALLIQRAKELYQAIQRQRDYGVVHLLARRGESNARFECIVVDVESDGVPPRNAHGIRYRERLALRVPADPKRLVRVLALRRDFPTLIHQNQSPVGEPADLCLYFEPSSAVLRTWTPQKFLRRIQWWLEQSAKGVLHPTDQPVEHLFFVSPYELVLPWNFADLRRRPEQRFVICRAGPRPDLSETFFVVPAMNGGGSGEPTAALIELTLPPILHGQIERYPTTLGELADTLSARGVDTLRELEHAIEQQVNEHGAAEIASALSILVLHVPIVRTAGAEPERIDTRAFLLLTGPMRIGELIGALIVFQKKYFRATGMLGERRGGNWRPEVLFPMEVLRFNDRAAAQAQSGLRDPGPAGVLVGAGSLGSAMLELWGRSGWGEWTVIDKDHIRPHNLVRHVAYAHQVGQQKSEVVAQLHDAVMNGASRATSVSADATDLSDVAVLNALKAATLVVDASTTLEYPRLASVTQDIGRHVSVFITPSGNAAALFAEDSNRSIRLRTLEAQYYRAVIQQPWGEHHLEGNLGTFWSGASCRDISMVLPYSRVVAHAGVLAEQVQRAASRAEATIRVWSRDADSGAVVMHEIAASAERGVPCNDLQVYIDAGLEQKLRVLRSQGLPEETGGVLLGYHDFNVSALVLADVLAAPSDSNTSTAFFERGVQGLTAAVNEAARRTAGIVGYVGEWHSHPRGYSSAPSDHDLFQLIYLAVGMADDGLPAVSVIVGETDIEIMGGIART
jgi:integrative and conjugative element protein (TIGR02256 family)